MDKISFSINGQRKSLELEPDTRLLWVIRDTLGLTGTKYSCGRSLCGTCTVHLDGEPIRSCTTLVSAVAGREVTTIEGLSTDLSHPLQRTWIEEEVSQCGYCQPGQIMLAAALLAKKPRPSDRDIETTMSRALCRCGTYQRIRRAIHRAAREV